MSKWLMVVDNHYQICFVSSMYSHFQYGYIYTLFLGLQIISTALVQVTSLKISLLFLIIAK
jgi:hypothetical protein